MQTRAIILLKAEPTPAQIQAGNYRKKHLRFQGLDLSIENPKGSVRRGKDRDGKSWETRMRHDYGYIRRSKGVDGDHVDAYVGPNPDATHAYVVHQHKIGRVKQWPDGKCPRCGNGPAKCGHDLDEDKVMLGFDSEQKARDAYLAHYDDPRFLGPITAMPMDEFNAKVRATKDNPKLIKSLPVLFLKSYVRAHTRRLKSGEVVRVGSYHTKVAAKPKLSTQRARDSRTMDLFGKEEPANEPEKSAKPSGHYVTMVREGNPKRVAWLAGPFKTHEEAVAHVDRARAVAHEVDPWSEFDAFGTASRQADHHPPGVLNEKLGLSADQRKGV